MLLFFVISTDKHEWIWIKISFSWIRDFSLSLRELSSFFHASFCLRVTICTLSPQCEGGLHWVEATSPQTQLNHITAIGDLQNLQHWSFVFCGWCPVHLQSILTHWASWIKPTKHIKHIHTSVNSFDIYSVPSSVLPPLRVTWLGWSLVTFLNLTVRFTLIGRVTGSLQDI